MTGIPSTEVHVPDPRRGQTEVWAVAVIGAAFLLLLTFTDPSAGATPVAAYGRPLILLALGYFAAGRRSWARSLIVFWLGLLGVFVALETATVLRGTGIPQLVAGVCALLLVGGAILLMTSKHVRALYAPAPQAAESA